MYIKLKSLFRVHLLFFVIYACTNKEVREQFYDDGALKAVAEFKNGKANGKYNAYYENGSLKTELTYLDGQMHGIRKEYYQNGILRFEVPYENGKENGIYKRYYPNGTVEMIVSYIDGKQHGITKEYNEEGILHSIGNYEYGIGEGEGKFYYPNGQVKLDYLKENSITVFYEEYAEDGNAIEKYRQINIISTNDTLESGTSYNATITVMGPIKSDEVFSELSIIMVGKGANNKLVEIALENGKANYISEELSAGKYILNINLSETDPPGVYSYHAAKDIIVLEKVSF